MMVLMANQNDLESRCRELAVVEKLCTDEQQPKISQVDCLIGDILRALDANDCALAKTKTQELSHRLQTAVGHVFLSF